MKLKIKPYFLTLLKENALYIGANILLLVLLLFSTIINLPKLFENQKKVEILSQEIAQLQRRSDFLNSVVADTTELESDIKFLNSLIPNSEDYFSIIYALEQLSLKTNFIINSYTVDMKNSNANKLRLTVNGTGDREAFMKFLEEYNFGGDRLITSDKIELTQQLSGGIKIDLTFYNKNVTSEATIPAPQTSKYLSEIRGLKNKVQFSLKEGTEETGLDYGYRRKTNPF